VSDYRRMLSPECCCTYFDVAYCRPCTTAYWKQWEANVKFVESLKSKETAPYVVKRRDD
jgi:hypothetical protein